jgi:hypothetical protein
MPLTLQELLFGLFGGGLAALEAVLKGVAQSGVEGRAYLRRCRVSMMASAYNIAYIGLPLILTAVVIPGETIGFLPIAGLVFLAGGAVIMLFQA